MVGLAVPIVLALVGVGAGIIVSDASATEFWAVRGLFIFVALWILAFAVYSLWPKLGEPFWWRAALGALAGALIVFLLFGAIHWVDIREARNLRKLIPANDPTPALQPLPPNVAAAMPDPFIILFGRTVVRAAYLPLVVLKIGQREMLAVDFDDDRRNLLVKTLRIFDDRNDIITRIDDDEVWIKEGNRFKRPDMSSLVIYDHDDAEVLNLKLLNRRALRVKGTFRNPGGLAITVTDDTIKFGTNTLTLGGMTLIGPAATAFQF